jgi:hypothetical protein
MRASEKPSCTHFREQGTGVNGYTSPTSTSGSSPSMAEKRTFGALSVRNACGEVRADYGLGFQEPAYYQELR